MKGKESVPLLSGSLVVSRQSKGGDQVVVQVRKASMKFPGSVVFPGGKTDPQDFQLFQTKEKMEACKFTSLRQTYQQIGLGYLPPKLNNQKALQVIKCAASYYKFIAENKSLYLAEIQPLFRFVTIYGLGMQRFDTVFFLPGPGLRLVNLKLAFLKGVQSLQNFSEVLFQNKQIDRCFWSKPEFLFQQHQRKQLLLFPPQQVICILLSKYSVADVFRQLGKVQTEAKYQPILFIEYGEHFYHPLDKQYHLQTFMRKEPDSQFRRQFIEYYSRHRKAGYRARFTFRDFVFGHPEVQLSVFRPISLIAESASL